jgi:hypothetical protein
VGFTLKREVQSLQRRNHQKAGISDVPRETRPSHEATAVYTLFGLVPEPYAEPSSDARTLLLR